MRVAIVHSGSDFHFDTVPGMYNGAIMLAEAGYKVDILATREASYPVPEFDSPDIRFMHIQPRWERSGPHRWIPARYSYALRLAGLHRREPYRCVIGVDPWGLVQAARYARMLRVTHVYYSLELLLSDEIERYVARVRHRGGRPDSNGAERSTRAGTFKSVTGDYRAARKVIGLKKREAALSRSAGMVITQDAGRAALLARDNRLDPDSILLVPNAPLGPARRSTKRLWHERFSLPADAKIALYIGSLGDWTGTEQLVRSAVGWPEGWVLVIHTRTVEANSRRYEELARLGASKRVFFSTRPVSRTELTQLIDAADVGCASYVATGDCFNTQANLLSVGLSSGKIMHYLACGLPVIVNRIESLRPLVEGSGCGIIVDDWKSAGAALNTIESSYNRFSLSATEVFDRSLDFRKQFRPVIERINGL